MFNVDKDKHRFEIKKEYIKGGFWVSKRYGHNGLSDNGVDCDKLDVKGLDVKTEFIPNILQRSVWVQF